MSGMPFKAVFRLRVAAPPARQAALLQQAIRLQRSLFTT